MRVRDADGVAHEYMLDATSQRRAKREAREWVARAKWDATLVGVRPVEGSSPHRLALASLAFVACGVPITVAIVIGLSRGGVL
jgi:hypothetical protein